MSEQTSIEIAVQAAILAERERIAQALDYEAEIGPCEEDNVVMRDAAWLVRADFSYEEAERLMVQAEARAAEGLPPA